MDISIIDKFVSPDGYYGLGGVLSKAEAVSVIVSKCGKPSRTISIEDANRLISENTVAATPLQKEQSAFTEAGVLFIFIGDFIYAKSLPVGAVIELEHIKESKSEGYVFLKREFGLPIVQDAGVCVK